MKPQQIKKGMTVKYSEDKVTVVSLHLNYVVIDHNGITKQVNYSLLKEV